MRPVVGFGGPILLIVLGAILYYAVSFSISGISISMIGLILMVAGLIWLIISLISAFSTRNRSTVVERRDTQL